MDSYVFGISLWVSHPDADLSEVPVKLGLQHKYLWIKGAPRMTRKGRALVGFYDWSRCAFEIDAGQETSLPAGLRAAVELLERHRNYLGELSAGGIELKFFVGIYADSHNARDILDWNLLRDLADLKISLDLDFYGPDPDSVNPSDEPDDAA